MKLTGENRQFPQVNYRVHKKTHCSRANILFIEDLFNITLPSILTSSRRSLP